MSTESILLIIAAVGVVIVNIVNALNNRQLKTIAHDVNSAAAAQRALVSSLTAEVKVLTALLADERHAAALLAEHQKRNP